MKIHEEDRILFSKMSHLWGLTEDEESAIVTIGEPEEGDQLRRMLSAYTYIRHVVGENEDIAKWLREPIAEHPFGGLSPIDMLMDSNRGKSEAVLHYLRAISSVKRRL